MEGFVQNTHPHDYGCRHGGRHDGWRVLFARREGRGAEERPERQAPSRTQGTVTPRTPVTPASVPGSIIGTSGEHAPHRHPAHGRHPGRGAAETRDQSRRTRAGSRVPRRSHDFRRDDGWAASTESPTRHDYGCRHGGRHDGSRGLFARREGRGAEERPERQAPSRTQGTVPPGTPVTPASVPGSIIGTPGEHAHRLRRDGPASDSPALPAPPAPAPPSVARPRPRRRVALPVDSEESRGLGSGPSSALHDPADRTPPVKSFISLR
ncbi:hypothetical protein GGQ63_003243 [Prosthecomicrobium pneumaticum]|uniref:Uncharacterized protein n=1 Tax=Prosthecomicrobium pneumaticum TaxID=81895 RepID=A0A7W9L345_9HYPH|nr:hypothetical protein [Prosthecomicrobium pneumaticum]